MKSRLARSILSMVLWLALAAGFVSYFGTAERVKATEPRNGETEIYFGDVNNDGKITPKDVTLLRRFLSSDWDVKINEKKADVDADGKITPKDVTTLRRYLLGGWGIELPEKPDWQLSGTVGLITVEDDSKVLVNPDGTLNSGYSNEKWVLGDGFDAKLQIAVGYTWNGKTRYEGMDTAGSIADMYTSYKVRSSSEKCVMISSVMGNKIKLIGNTPGESIIIVYGVEASGKETVVGAIPVQFLNKRAPAVFTFTSDKNVLDLANPNDRIILSFDLRDQYGDAIKGQPVNIGYDPKYAPTNFSRPAYTGSTFVITSSDVTSGVSGLLSLRAGCGVFSENKLVKLENSGCPEMPLLNVASLEIPVQNIEPGNYAQLQIIAKDSEGNEISLDDLQNKSATLSITLNSYNDLDAYVSGKNIFIGSPNRIYDVYATLSYIATDDSQGYVTNSISAFGTVSSFINDDYSFDYRYNSEILVTSSTENRLVNADGTRNSVTEVMTCSMDTPQNYAIQIAVPYYNAEGMRYESFDADLGVGDYIIYRLKTDNQNVIELGEVTNGKQLFTCKNYGEATVTLYGVKDDYSEVELASKKISVSRALNNIPKPLSTAQASLDSYKVDFDAAIKDVLKSDFEIYYKIGDTRIPFASAQVVYTNENTATVKLYSSFDQGREYFVYFMGELVGSFVSATVTPDSVKFINITQRVLEVNKTSRINYRLYDINGVDITDALGTALDGKLEFSVSNPNLNVIIDGDGKNFDITFNDVYEEAVIVGKYKWNKNGDWYMNTVEAQAKFVSKEELKWEVNGITLMSVPEGSPRFVDSNGQLNPKTVAKRIVIDGAGNGYASALALAVNYKKYDGYESESYQLRCETFSTAGQFGSFESYEIKSSDNGILMLSSSPDNDRIGITPVSAGTVTITVYGLKAGGGKTFIGECEVEVLPESVPSQVIGYWTSEKSTLNMAYAQDSVSIKPVVRDQYGQEMEATVNIQQQTVNEYIYSGPATIKAGEMLTLTPDMFSPTSSFCNGYVDLKLTCGSASYVIQVEIGYAISTSRYILKLSADSLGNAVTPTNSASTLTVSLEGRSVTGLVTPGTALMFSREIPKSGKCDENFGTYYVYTVKKNGIIINEQTLGQNFDLSTNTFYSVVRDASGYAVKMPTGTYEIMAFEVKTIETTAGFAKVISLVGKQEFKVVDDQPRLNITMTDKVEKLYPEINEDTIKGAFSIRFMDRDISNDVSYTYTVNGDGDLAYVKSVTYTVENPDLGRWIITTIVDAVVKKAQ
ncbi:MAG: hypothetical protein K6E47_16685 [Lachnospiraceae bacterium]|nr:hypothetical protein [Lachnospiraceae bacterium]